MPVHSEAATPPWAQYGWEDVNKVQYFRVDGTTSFTIYTTMGVCSIPAIYVRLFANETFVAGAKILGPNNFDLAEHNVLCSVEVHPDHRGQRYSARLLELVRQEIGTIYQTGSLSRSGNGIQKYCTLPVIPGREIDVTDRDEYSFIDWDCGSFHDS